MEINLSVPDFTLNDQHDTAHSLNDFRGRIVIVNFWSAECPWSERADAHLLAVARQFPDEIVLLSIASNLNETSGMISQASEQRGLDLVLIDAHCDLADAWGAQTTPHAFVIDPSGSLRYQGAVDDITFRKRNPEHFYVEDAVKAILDGKMPEIQTTRPYGCTIVRTI
jgi:peroxiredoxin